MLGRHQTVAATATLLLSGCMAAPSCLPGEEGFTESRLYFGRSIAGQPEPDAVTEADWAAFVAAEITPRFPNGFTVLDGTGHWRGDEGGTTEREYSKVLEVLSPTPERAQAAEKLKAIASAYRTRFRQQSVLQSGHTVCTRFHD